MQRRHIIWIVIIAIIAGGVWYITALQRARKTQELLTKLASQDESEALDAMDQLRHRGRELEPALVRMLASDNPRVRWRAAMLAAQIRMRNPKGRAQLAKLVSDPSPAVQRAAIVAVGQLGIDQAAGALLKVVGSDNADPDVRALAALALGRLAHERAVKPLAKLLSQHPPVKPKAEQQPEEEAQATEEAAAEAEEDEAAKEEEQPDELWRARMEAALALGHISGPDAVEALTQACRDDTEPRSDVRVAACYALADAYDKLTKRDDKSKVVHALVDALADEVGDVRIAAAQSLAKIYPPKEDQEAVERAIKEHLDDEHYWVRAAAKLAAENLGISTTE